MTFVFLRILFINKMTRISASLFFIAEKVKEEEKKILIGRRIICIELLTGKWSYCHSYGFVLKEYNVFHPIATLLKVCFIRFNFIDLKIFSSRE